MAVPHSSRPLCMRRETCPASAPAARPGDSCVYSRIDLLILLRLARTAHPTRALDGDGDGGKFEITTGEATYLGWWWVANESNTVYFFLPGIATPFPLRVLALFLVPCPRTGSPMMCLLPR